MSIFRENDQCLSPVSGPSCYIAKLYPIRSYPVLFNSAGILPGSGVPQNSGDWVDMNIVHVVEQPPILVASRVQLEVTLLSDFHMPAPTLIMGVTIAIIRFRGKRRANTLHWYSWLKTALIYN